MKILDDAEIRKIVTNADPKRAIEDLVAHYLNLADEVTMECRELRAQNASMSADRGLAANDADNELCLLIDKASETIVELHEEREALRAQTASMVTRANYDAVAQALQDAHKEREQLRAQNMTMKAALILAAGALEGVTTSTVGPSWKLAQELRTIAGES